MDTIRTIEAEGLKKDIPEFRPGDHVKVHVRVVEGDKSRIQVFEGDVISRRGGNGARRRRGAPRRRRGNGARATFAVRKSSSGVGVERIFPLHSPIVEKIERLREGEVRQAKLYYLRQLRGKKARIRERQAR